MLLFRLELLLRSLEFPPLIPMLLFFYPFVGHLLRVYSPSILIDKIIIVEFTDLITWQFHDLLIQFVVAANALKILLTLLEVQAVDPSLME